MQSVIIHWSGSPDTTLWSVWKHLVFFFFPLKDSCSSQWQIPEFFLKFQIKKILVQGENVLMNGITDSPW